MPLGDEKFFKTPNTKELKNLYFLILIITVPYSSSLRMGQTKSQNRHRFQFWSSQKQTPGWDWMHTSFTERRLVKDKVKEVEAGLGRDQTTVRV